MKGINLIMLNYDTVLEAVQEYLDRRMTTPPIVLGIGVSSCGSWSPYKVIDTQGNTTVTGEMEARIQEPVGFLKGGST